MLIIERVTEMTLKWIINLMELFYQLFFFVMHSDLQTQKKGLNFESSDHKSGNIPLSQSEFGGISSHHTANDHLKNLTSKILSKDALLILIICVQLLFIFMLLRTETQPKLIFLNSTEDFGTLEKGELDVIQKKFVFGFQCNPNTIRLFKNIKPFVTKKNMKMFKVPYPQLILYQPNADPIPTYHYPELAVYMLNIDPVQYIYVHSAPLYALLIMAAATPEKTSIILSHSFPQKRQATSLFVMNSLKPKLILQTKEDSKANMEKADLFIVSNGDVKQGVLTKPTLIVAESRIPSFRSTQTFKLVSSELCGIVREQPYDKEVYEPGLYLLKKP